MNEQPTTSTMPWCAGERPPGTQTPPPCIFVIFGAGGDLTQRLLVPALYNLSCWKLLPERFAIIGVGRSPRTHEQFRQDVVDAVRTFTHGSFNSEAMRRVTQNAEYLQGDVNASQTYDQLASRLRHLFETISENVLFYLAIAPEFFAPIVHGLGNTSLLRESDSGWRRVIFEKPFGHDLESAKALDKDILAILKESQIYRIDHFLGKETVQNILAFRFANGFFEPMWNRDHIDHVQITVAETVGVEQRGNFYEKIGALRDMVPNHLFQLLTMTAMEPPISFNADAVRNKQDEVLRAVHPLSPAEARDFVVRGQYVAGTINEQSIPAYRDEPRVDRLSWTETYVALRLMIDNWRWGGVPFYLRTGKRMSRRTAEIAIRFKPAPYLLFRNTPVDRIAADWMVLRIQPDEGIALEFNAKIPGPTVRLERVDMNFSYKDYFRVEPSTGYETLIYDCMIGDPTLFRRADNIEASWLVVQPVVDAWAMDLDGQSVYPYPAGSAGPEQAAALLAREGRAWRPIARQE
jgi:glucose-6-phosphate 1-dehydrogenase